MQYPTAVASAGLALILALLLAPQTAMAGVGEDKVRCLELEGRTMDQLVADCTLVIESGRYSGGALAEVFIKRGAAWHVKGDNDRAIQDFDQAIKLKPDEFAFTDRGNAWASKGDYDRAIADYSEAIRISPNFTYAYLNRSLNWSKKGDNVRATHDLDTAIGIDPTFTSAFMASCEIRSAANLEPDRAMRDCDKAIRYTVNYPDLYASRAQLWFNRREFEKAIADENAALKIDPKYSMALLGRGVAELALGRQAQGQADISAARAIDPKIPEQPAIPSGKP